MKEQALGIVKERDVQVHLLANALVFNLLQLHGLKTKKRSFLEERLRTGRSPPFADPISPGDGKLAYCVRSFCKFARSSRSESEREGHQLNLLNALQASTFPWLKAKRAQ